MNKNIVGKRIKELVGIILIGDGVVGLVDPERHARLWRRGPEGYQKVMGELVRRPGATQLLSAAEIALGIWLAARQKTQAGKST
jgi:hypothetical protein